MIFPVQLLLDIKNQCLIFQIPLQKGKYILIYGIFSGSFLDNFKWLFFIKLW